MEATTMENLLGFRVKGENGSYYNAESNGNENEWNMK